METQKLLLKDEDVCACARYQVNPKVSHLHAVKRIFSVFLNDEEVLTGQDIAEKEINEAEKVKNLFDKAMKRVNTFVYMILLVEKTRAVKSKKQKAEETIAKEGSKRINIKFRRNWLGLKDFLMILEFTAAQLMLLVYKLLLLVFRVNAASTKVTTAEKLRLLKEFLLSENG
ncbi:hypothetical protein Tco_1238467 [Tanacetum coccineum]